MEMEKKRSKGRSAWLILPLLAISVDDKTEDYELMFGWLNSTWPVKMT